MYNDLDFFIIEWKMAAPNAVKVPFLTQAAAIAGILLVSLVAGQQDPRIRPSISSKNAAAMASDPQDGAAPPASRSRCVTETVNGSHHFAINGYSLAKGMGVGKYISSNTFTVGNYQWAIYFYPDGKNAEDNSLYVSVFIALASEGTDVRALFELTLLDQSGKDKHKVHSHFDRSLESGPYTLKSRGSMWGYKRFFRRAVLETSDYLKDDSLSITCTVGVVVSSMQMLRQQSLPVPESDMGLRNALLDSAERTSWYPDSRDA